MYEIIENGANIASDVKIGNYTVSRSGAKIGKGSELSSGTYVREYACLGEGCYTVMSSHIVKDVEPFSFILKNKNNGDATKLIDKYNISSMNLPNCDLILKSIAVVN